MCQNMCWVGDIDRRKKMVFFIIVVEPAHAEVPLSNDVSGVAASPHLLQHLLLKFEDQLRISS